jgi:hypothetical protein
LMSRVRMMKASLVSRCTNKAQIHHISTHSCDAKRI